jgi:hypothetical protein
LNQLRTPKEAKVKRWLTLNQHPTMPSDPVPPTAAAVDAPLPVAEEVHSTSPPPFCAHDLGMLSLELAADSRTAQFQRNAANDDTAASDIDSTFGDNSSSTASVASSILEYRTINGRTYHSDRSVNADAIQYWSDTMCNKAKMPSNKH